ncbi:MAG TPA: hypothetical protein VK783_12585 [Bacteroidia bacterium]|nr:hypothetical protein [Bacteroidia bacterium]
MRQRVTEIGLILAGAIILCYAGFYNNFPLVYSDTADYLGGAFGHYIPFDRPVFYGLFMKYVSLKSSLWLVIFAQGVLMSYLLFETFGMFYSGNKRNFCFIVSLAVLTACTGISQNTSILLPDIFSPIGILCFINLLLNNKLNMLRRIVIACVLILCVLVHFSNMLVLFSLAALVAVYAIYKHFKKKQIAIKRNRLVLCFALVSSVFLLAPIGNYMFGKKFIMSEGAHVFIMNHLVETGILDEYLNNECGKTTNCRMCQFKGKVDTNFIWSGNGAFAQMGGWEGSRDEFDRIIWDVVTTPKYELMLLQRCSEYTFIQYFMFSVPANTNWGVPPYMKNNYKLQGRDFCASLQSANKLDYSTSNHIQMILVLISMAFLLFIVLTPLWFNQLSTELKWFAILILVFSFLNAAICANFSTLNERFQNRIIWLIPLTTFFIAEQLISKYLREKKSAN